MTFGPIFKSYFMIFYGILEIISTLVTPTSPSEDCILLRNCVSMYHVRKYCSYILHTRMILRTYDM